MLNTSIRKNLDQTDFELLSSLCHKYGIKKTYKKNDEILTFGASPTQLLVLVKGIVKYSFIDDDGNEYVEEFISSGQLFGDIMASADRIGHTVIITALSKVDVICLNLKMLYAAIPHEQRLYIEQVFQTVINKLHLFFWDQSSERSVTPAEVRYQWLKEQEPEVIKHASAKDIASFLRISTEQLRRIKLKLQKSAV